MNIGILSMQKVPNYGSFLQALALKKELEKLSLGGNVYFIDIEEGAHIIPPVQKNKRPKNLLKKLDKYALKRIENLLFSMHMDKIHRQDYITYLQTDKKLPESEEFDIVVIGSDEVFNCLQKSKWGFSSQLFGNVDSAQKVITYAASCGSTKADNLSHELREAIKKAMSNLSAVSVRDKNTAEFVKAVTGKKSVYNLDPVAVGDFEDEIRNATVGSQLPEKYCIVYSYSERINDPEEIRAISRYCKEHALKIVAPFGRQKWIQSYETLTPFELLKAFQNAECIVTDTFHGTLFGAKFGNRMAVLIRESNRNKLEDLTHRLQIQDHVITDLSQLSTVLDKDLNKKKINEILSMERIRSLEYLKENL